MTDRTKDWDDAISRFIFTGKMSPSDRQLVLNSCPTCCDTGMDEGVFCDDCEQGKRLRKQSLG